MLEKRHRSLLFFPLTDLRKPRGQTIAEAGKWLRTAYLGSLETGAFLNINFMLKTANCFAVTKESRTFAYRSLR